MSDEMPAREGIVFLAGSLSIFLLLYPTSYPDPQKPQPPLLSPAQVSHYIA